MERWQDAGIDDYTITYTGMGGIGPFGPKIVQVENGRAAEVDTDDPTQLGPSYSVNDLFDELEAADRVVSAEFDADLGYPTAFELDPIEGAIDDEFSIQVVDLEYRIGIASLERFHPTDTPADDVEVRLIDPTTVEVDFSDGPICASDLLEMEPESVVVDYQTDSIDITIEPRSACIGNADAESAEFRSGVRLALTEDTAGRPITVTAGNEEPVTLPATANPNPGPLMRHTAPQTDAGEAAEIIGVLELEIGCLYVVSDETERYPIVWPNETRWDAGQQVVILSGGEQVAPGERVSGGGGYYNVDQVEGFAGSEASALAERCVDNTFGEIAVVNNTPDGISPGE